MTAAVLHAQQLGLAVVELVIAHGVEVEAEAIHGLDGAFVMKQRGHQRARADHVASRHHDGRRILLLELLHVSGHRIDAASRHAVESAG